MCDRNKCRLLFFVKHLPVSLNLNITTICTTFIITYSFVLGLCLQQNRLYVRFAYARKITIPKCKLPFMKTEIFGSQKKDHDVLFSATKIRISEKCKLEFNVTRLALTNKSSYIMFLEDEKTTARCKNLL